MQDLGQVPGVLTPEDIISQFGEKGGPLDQLVESAHDPQYDFERLTLVRKARYNWRMVQGDQFIAPGFTSDWTNQELVDFVSVDTSSETDEPGAAVTFSYPFNVLGGDCYKFVAVIGQSAPKVKAVADDPESQENLEQATDADAELRDLWTQWDADSLQRVLAFHQYTTGPVFLHTPYVADAAKYGQSTEPKISVQSVPQPDGTSQPVPSEQGVETYPNGDCELHLHTVLDVQVPFGAKKRADCGWFVLEYMQSKFKLLQAYPGPLEKYRNSEPPDDEFGAATAATNEARDSVQNPSGVGRPKKPYEWRFRQIWVRPEQYEAIQDKKARKVLKTQYAKGLYLAKVGNVIVDIDNRLMDDEWAICKTGRGEKIMEAPIAQDSVPIQRALNDLANLAVETVLRSIAKTIVDQMLIDRNSISKNEALPAELIFTTTQGVGDLSKMIAQIPPARVSDQLTPIFQMFRALQQDITGIRPELAGAGPPTATFREAKQRKDQALMQLSPQAAAISAAWEEAGANGVRMRARYANGGIKVRRQDSYGSRTDMVEHAQVSETGWHCEADDNWPMTTADTFDKLYGLLKEFPPEVQQQLGILDAINLERNLQILQLPGYESPFEDQKRKTIADIRQLLQGQPTPGPDGTPQPSLDPSQFQYDDHTFVSPFVKKWMLSKDGQKSAATNPQGFANVAAFQMAQDKMAQPPQPPPPPPVRGGLNFSAKLEDMPWLTPQVMEAAGINVPPQAGQPALPPPSKPGASPDAGQPPAPNAQPPAGSPDEPPPGNGLPPLPPIEGPPPPPTIQ